MYLFKAKIDGYWPMNVSVKIFYYTNIYIIMAYIFVMLLCLEIYIYLYQYQFCAALEIVWKIQIWQSINATHKFTFMPRTISYRMGWRNAVCHFQNISTVINLLLVFVQNGLVLCWRQRQTLARWPQPWLTIIINLIKYRMHMRLCVRCADRPHMDARIISIKRHGIAEHVEWNIRQYAHTRTQSFKSLYLILSFARWPVPGMPGTCACACACSSVQVHYIRVCDLWFIIETFVNATYKYIHLVKR